MVSSYLWIIFGLIVSIAELVIPSGFALLIIGVISIGIGLIGTFLGLEIGFKFEGLIFSALAIITLFFASKKIKENINEDNLMGISELIALDAVSIGGKGRAEGRGTSWDIHNIGTNLIIKGDKLRILSRKGILIEVERQ